MFFTMATTLFRAISSDDSRLDKFCQRAVRFCFCLMMAALPGCLVGPKYQKPVATTETTPASYKESPTQFKDGEGWKVAQPRDAMLRGPWWRIFKDPELNALEEQVNINNQNIKEFFQNFMEARALVAAPSEVDETIGAECLNLSRREREVLSLLPSGATNKDIAGRLFISVHTVERHLANIYTKLGIRGRAEASAVAVRMAPKG